MLSKVRMIAALGGVTVLLGSCGTIDGRNDNSVPRTAGGRSVAGQAVSDVPVKIGPPYEVGGVTYTPEDPVTYDEVGYASWYGEELSGNSTSNGEMFNPAGVSAAHRTLPLPSYVEVTALDTGRTILVRVNDRGPFTRDRLIDLSRGAAEQLGIAGGGAVAVRVRRVNPPDQERVVLRSGGRAAERLETPAPLLTALRAKLGLKPAPVVAAKARAKVAPAKLQSAPAVSAEGGFAVQVAAFSSQDRAEALARRIGASAMRAGSVWRVRYGPYPSEAAARAGIDQAAAKGFRDARIVAND